MIRSNRNLDYTYHTLGEYDNNIDYYKEALEISTATGDRPGIANSNGNLGNVYDSLGLRRISEGHWLSQKRSRDKHCYWQSIRNSKKQWQFGQCLL